MARKGWPEMKSQKGMASKGWPEMDGQKGFAQMEGQKGEAERIARRKPERRAKVL